MVRPACTISEKGSRRNGRSIDQCENTGNVFGPRSEGGVIKDFSLGYNMGLMLVFILKDVSFSFRCFMRAILHVTHLHIFCLCATLCDTQSCYCIALHCISQF